MSKTRRWALTGLGAAGITALAVPRALGIRRLEVQGTPSSGPPAWDSYAEFLATTVRGGAVDWPVAHAHQEQAEDLYATLAEYGPETAPHAFPDSSSRLAYAINAYNLLVIVAVLRHWPISGVGEVRGVIEPKDHFGFFYGLRLRLDGRWVNLYSYERKMFAQWPDSRIHAAINCASESCPPLVPVPFRPQGLDTQLDTACRDWLARPGQVEVASDSREVRVPPLLGLYPGEFGAAAQALGWGQTDVGWVLHWLEPPRAAQIREGLDKGYSLVIPPYGWALSQPS